MDAVDRAPLDKAAETGGDFVRALKRSDDEDD
jgi:hypothetical protein